MRWLLVFRASVSFMIPSLILHLRIRKEAFCEIILAHACNSPARGHTAAGAGVRRCMLKEVEKELNVRPSLCISRLPDARSLGLVPRHNLIIHQG